MRPTHFVSPSGCSILVDCPMTLTAEAAGYKKVVDTQKK
jgi:hypothetical protein